MNKTSQGILAGTTAILITGSLAACGSTTPSSQASGNVVHLVYWNMWSGHWSSVIQHMVNDFNKTHPKIQVTMLSVPSTSGDAKLLTAIAAGNPPDVFTEWNPTIGSFAASKGIMPLNQFMTGHYRNVKKWFYPIALKFSTYHKQIWALPMSLNTFMLYYNKTLMKQAGLNPNTPPKTITQWNAEQAKMWKFNSNGGLQQVGYYPLVPNGGDEFDPLSNPFHYNPVHGHQYNLLSSNALNEMKWIGTYAKYPYSKVMGFMSAYNAAAGGSEDSFDVGKEGFWVNGMWDMSQIQAVNAGMKYGVAPLPAPSAGTYGGTWVNGNYNIIPKGAKHPHAAFQFILWMAGYQNTNWAGKHDAFGNWVPPSPQVTDSSSYQKFLSANPLRKKFVQILSNPHNSVTPLTPVEQEYVTKINNAMSYVLDHKETPLQAVTHVQNIVNAQWKRDIARGE